MRICTGAIKAPIFIQFSLLITLLLCVIGTTIAQENLIPRKILALYKSSEGESEQENSIYYKAQLPLNNLGLVVTYTDAEGQLPSLNEMKDYRGIITWFANPGMKNAKQYRNWLMKMQESGKYVVILGNFGAHHEPNSSTTDRGEKEVLKIFKFLGLRYNLDGWQIVQPQIVLKNKDFYDYEVPFQASETEYIGRILSVGDRNQVLLSLKIKDNRSDFAVLSPHGGYIHSQVIYRVDSNTFHAEWYINPSKFFDRAFQCEDLPVADINTVGGHRTAFIHIDGDGFSTISKINHWHICGALVKNRVLTKFAFPFSYSVIAAEIDPTFIGNSTTIEVAREIFKLPNVEPASHGFAHPHNWKTGKMSLQIGFYSFDPVLETIGSIKYIKENLVPPEKPVELFFWTGMCNPNQSEIDLLENQGFLQINGGAGLLDKERPSISTFYPPYGQVGNKIRVNSRISNEFEFTNGWQGPLDGYKDVIHSIEFTGGDRPVTPANIYFHPYIMEWDDGWRSLRQVFKWAEQQDWTFVYTSDYIESVKDFVGMKITKMGANEYFIFNDGNLRSIRFRDEKRSLNLALSKNITGFTKIKDDLLVHLNAKKNHKIVLGEISNGAPNIRYANQIVDSLEIDKDKVLLYVRGYGNFRTTLRNFNPDTYYAIEKFSSSPKSIQNKNKQASTFSQSEVFSSTIQYSKSDGDGNISFESFITNSNKIVIWPSSSVHYYFSRLKYWILLVALVGFILIQTSLARTNKSNLLTKVLIKKK